MNDPKKILRVVRRVILILVGICSVLVGTSSSLAQNGSSGGNASPDISKLLSSSKAEDSDSVAKMGAYVSRLRVFAFVLLLIGVSGSAIAWTVFGRSTQAITILVVSIFLFVGFWVLALMSDPFGDGSAYETKSLEHKALEVGDGSNGGESLFFVKPVKVLAEWLLVMACTTIPVFCVIYGFWFGIAVAYEPEYKKMASSVIIGAVVIAFASSFAQVFLVFTKN